MKTILENFYSKVIKDKKSLQELKKLAVNLKQYELGSELRDIELKQFPETNEEKSAKELADKLNLVFRMVELQINAPTCWLIHETLKMYSKKKGNFSIDDASDLLVKMKQIFTL